MRTVVLCGNSLVVSSVGASLQADTSLRVLPFNASAPGATARLEELGPDVIIFDLATVRPELNISLWKAHPNVLLIGMDLARDEMLVLSGQPATARSPKELKKLVNGPKRGLAEPQNVETASYLRRSTKPQLPSSPCIRPDAAGMGEEKENHENA